MTERPILFSGPMVRAILEGRKHQTRRVVSWPIRSRSDGAKRRLFLEDETGIVNALLESRERHPCRQISCPYGQPGDRLWVRETWYCDHVEVPERGPLPKTPPASMSAGHLYFRASDAAPGGRCYTGFSGETMSVPWRPSIHMPRWASRVTLEVTAVRVERLLEISEEDAKAEGYESAESFLAGDWAKSKVDTHPYVWVVEFRKVKP